MTPWFKSSIGLNSYIRHVLQFKRKDTKQVYVKHVIVQYMLVRHRNMLYTPHIFHTLIIVAVFMK